MTWWRLLSVRRPQWWSPVDVYQHYGRQWHLLRLHGKVTGVRLGRRLYVVKELHRRIEEDCGRHPTYEELWRDHVRWDRHGGRD